MIRFMAGSITMDLSELLDYFNCELFIIIFYYQLLPWSKQQAINYRIRYSFHKKKFLFKLVFFYC